MKIEKVEKLVTNLFDKNECAIDIRNLKHALNYGLVLKKVDRVIKFNPKDWLNLYTEMNTEQKQKPKNNFEKDFFKLKENVRNFYKPISLHFHFQFHFIFVVLHLKIHPAVHLNTSKTLTLL